MSLKRTEEVLLLTTAEAVTLVKRSERERARIYLHVWIDAAVEGGPDHIVQDGLCSHLELSRAGAKKLVSTLLSPILEAKGGRIRVLRLTWEGDPHPTYWIG